LNNNPSEFKKVLDGYLNRSEILRQANSDLSSKYKKRSNLIAVISVASSSLISILALADIERILKIFNSDIDPLYASYVLSFILAVLGLIIFLVSLSGFIFGWQDKHLRHESGVKLLTNIISEIRDVRKLTNESSDEIELASKVKEISDKYALINESLPTIPDQDFLNSKQKYRIKRMISENLDEDPCVDVSIKKYTKKHKQNR
jgi:hypothetical protein